MPLPGPQRREGSVIAEQRNSARLRFKLYLAHHIRNRGARVVAHADEAAEVLQAGAQGGPLIISIRP